MNRRIVRVRWLDHQEESDESTLDEGVGLATYSTVGYVTGESDTWLEVSRDIEVYEDTKAGSLCLLKAAITEVVELYGDR